MSLIWNAIKGATRNWGIGAAARFVQPAFQPKVFWHIPGQIGVLEPMTPMAARFAPIVRTAAKLGSGAGGGIMAALAPIAMVALNPTNRFPSSSEERRMIERAQNESFRQRQAAENRNRLRLTEPKILTYNPMQPIHTMTQQRLESYRLRPEPSIATPFNMRLINNSDIVKANPFHLSVMGPSPTTTPFKLSLNTNQLRAPFIGH
jgi:hypothetical protein